MKKLIPALALLLLSAVLLTTASYAWFSMNTKVTVTGMQVKTKVSSNLLIAGGALADAAKKADNLFTNKYEASITDVLLEPVSTTTGKAFFYTTDARSDGSKNAPLTGTDAVALEAYNAAEVPTSSELTDFNTAYSTTGAVGYVDYVFQLKATNTGDSAANIQITKLDLTYNKANAADDDDDENAFRVAVFVEDMGETGSTCTAGSGTLIATYKTASAANHDGKTANSTTTITGTPTYNGTATLASVAAGKTNYYKVVVRLWIEGQDTTCTNETFVDLTKTGAYWALDLDIELGTGTPITGLTIQTAS